MHALTHPAHLRVENASDRAIWHCAELVKGGVYSREEGSKVVHCEGTASFGGKGKHSTGARVIPRPFRDEDAPAEVRECFLKGREVCAVVDGSVDGYKRACAEESKDDASVLAVVV